MSAATLTDQQASERLLVAADELFYPYGVAAVTMTQIRDRSGVSLRRMYGIFPTKGDLIAGWLQHRHEIWTRWLASGIDAAVSTGASDVDAVFDVLARWLCETNYRGCGFINTLIEMHDLTDEHHRIIRDHKQQLVDVLSHRFVDARAMAVLIDGSIVQCTIFQNLTPLDAARRTAHIIQEDASS